MTTRQSMQYDLTATENVSQAVDRIAASVARMAAGDRVAFADLAGGLTQASRAAGQLEGALTSAAAAGQQSSGGGFLKDIAAFAAGGLVAQSIQAVGGALVGLGRDTLQTAGNLEQTRIAFVGLLGSAQAADAELAILRDLANRTPFTFEGLARAEQQMVAVGMSTREARQNLIDAGNAVAAFGGSAQQLNSVSLAIEQIFSKGKLQGQEALQLVNAGIPVWNLLAAAMGKSTAQVQALSEAGQISAAQFEKAFHTEAVERWGGAMDRQSHTLLGLISTAQDLGQTLENALGTPIIVAVEGPLEQLLHDLQDPTTAANLREMGRQIGIIAGELVQAADKATLFLSALFGGGQAAAGFAPIATGLNTVTTAVKGLTGQYADLQAQAGPAVSAIKAASDEYRAMYEHPMNPDQRTQEIAGFQSQLDGLKYSAAAVHTEYDGAIQSAQDHLTSLSRQMQDVRAADDAANAPIKERIRLLDEAYAAATRTNDEAKLAKDIARDQKLALNVFTSQGQAAKDRLENTELPQQQANALRDKHDAAKAAAEAEIRGNDATRDSALKKLEADQRATQDSITRQTRERDAKLQAISDEKSHLTDLIGTLKDYQKAAAAASDGTVGGFGAVDIAAGTTKTTVGNVGTAATNMADTATGALDRVTTGIGQITTAANNAQTAVQSIFSDPILQIFSKAQAGDWQGAFEVWKGAKAKDEAAHPGLTTPAAGHAGANAAAGAHPGDFVSDPLDLSSLNPLEMVGRAVAGAQARISGERAPSPAASVDVGRYDPQETAAAQTIIARNAGYKGHYVPAPDKKSVIWVPDPPGPANAAGPRSPLETTPLHLPSGAGLGNFAPPPAPTRPTNAPVGGSNRFERNSGGTLTVNVNVQGFAGEADWRAHGQAIADALGTYMRGAA